MTELLILYKNDTDAYQRIVKIEPTEFTNQLDKYLLISNNKTLNRSDSITMTKLKNNIYNMLMNKYKITDNEFEYLIELCNSKITDRSGYFTSRISNFYTLLLNKIIKQGFYYPSTYQYDKIKNKIDIQYACKNNIELDMLVLLDTLEKLYDDNDRFKQITCMFYCDYGDDSFSGDSDNECDCDQTNNGPDRESYIHLITKRFIENKELCNKAKEYLIKHKITYPKIYKYNRILCPDTK